MFTRIVVFSTSMLVLIILLPGIKDIMDSLREDMAELSGFSSLEDAYWGMFPIFLLVGFFVGGLYYLIKGWESDDRDERLRR